MSLSEFVSGAIMSPLQRQVILLGKCPFCKTKSLTKVPDSEHICRCLNCNRIYLTQDPPELSLYYPSK